MKKDQAAGIHLAIALLAPPLYGCGGHGAGPEDAAAAGPLWESKMDAPDYSAPSAYGIEGKKRYVVIVAGGGSRRASRPISVG